MSNDTEAGGEQRGGGSLVGAGIVAMYRVQLAHQTALLQAAKSFAQIAKGLDAPGALESLDEFLSKMLDELGEANTALQSFTKDLQDARSKL